MVHTEVQSLFIPQADQFSAHPIYELHDHPYEVEDEVVTTGAGGGGGVGGAGGGGGRLNETKGSFQHPTVKVVPVN